MAADKGALRDPHFWVRFAQLIFGIIAFAPVAEGAGYSRFDFAIFCGVTTMVIALAMMGLYLAGINGVRGIVSLVIDVVWWIFWLSCAAALSNTLVEWNGAWDAAGDLCDYYNVDCGLGSTKSRTQAACAFSWLTWFLFWASVALDIIDLRGGSHRTVTMAAPGKPAGVELPAGGAAAYPAASYSAGGYPPPPGPAAV